MSVIGTLSVGALVATVVAGYGSGAVVAGQFLTEWVAPCRGKLGGVQVHASTAGTGAGATVVDVLLNGVSVWSVAANRPTLAATSTGGFGCAAPDHRVVQVGDVLAIQVASVSTTGHARLKAAVAFEQP